MAAAQSGMNYCLRSVSKLPCRNQTTTRVITNDVSNHQLWRPRLGKRWSSRSRSVTQVTFNRVSRATRYVPVIEDFIVEGPPALWFHGHVHRTCVNRVGENSGRQITLLSRRGATVDQWLVEICDMPLNVRPAVQHLVHEQTKEYGWARGLELYGFPSVLWEAT